MLPIEIPETEYWDPIKEEFVYEKSISITLEHSLISVSKWEAKWHKPFISDGDKTDEEILDYIRFMTLTKNVDQSVYNRIDKKTIDRIVEYINDPMTATWFSSNGTTGPTRKKVYTAEVLYYLMISYGIPFECQKWHFNRLLTLIRVCQEKANSADPKKKKKTSRQLSEEYARLNAKRQAAKRGL